MQHMSQRISRGTILEESYQGGTCLEEETPLQTMSTNTLLKHPVLRYITANMELGLCFHVQNVPSSSRRLDVLMNISVLTFLPRSGVMPSANPVAKNSLHR